MKPLFTLALLLLPVVAAAQPSDTLTVREQALEFAKSALVSAEMLYEAPRAREYAFVTAAQRHNRAAAQSLARLRGRLDPTTLEEAQTIVGVLERVASAGPNLQAPDMLALEITRGKISRFMNAILEME